VRESLILTKWAVKETSDINTSNALLGGGRIGDAYIVGDVILRCLLVWMSNVWGKQ
jgi:hypothetical protein